LTAAAGNFDKSDAFYAAQQTVSALRTLLGINVLAFNNVNCR